MFCFLNIHATNMKNRPITNKLPVSTILGMIILAYATTFAQSGTKETEIRIKNKADYSQIFIQGLHKQGFERCDLQDSLMIINQKDSAYFPSTPIIGKEFVLTGRKDNLAIALTVTRTNYTTINYQIELIEFGKSSYVQSGKADIHSGFFFGPEYDESDKTGIGYVVTEFTESIGKDCFTAIRLGYEEETGPYLLGTLIKNCNGKIMDINLDNSMTLIEK